MWEGRIWKWYGALALGQDVGVGDKDMAPVWGPGTGPGCRCGRVGYGTGAGPWHWARM